MEKNWGDTPSATLRQGFFSLSNASDVNLAI